MKKVLFALFALGLYSVGANAQDDVYFVPTKKAILKERQAEREAAARTRTESSYTPIADNTAAKQRKDFFITIELFKVKHYAK